MRASGMIAGGFDDPSCPHPAPRPRTGSRGCRCAAGAPIFTARRPSPGDETALYILLRHIPLVTDVIMVIACTKPRCPSGASHKACKSAADPAQAGFVCRYPRFTTLLAYSGSGTPSLGVLSPAPAGESTPKDCPDRACVRFVAAGQAQRQGARSQARRNKPTGSFTGGNDTQTWRRVARKGGFSSQLHSKIVGGPVDWWQELLL
jgi:hypothetical protein